MHLTALGDRLVGDLTFLDLFFSTFLSCETNLFLEAEKLQASLKNRAK